MSTPAGGRAGAQAASEALGGTRRAGGLAGVRPHKQKGESPSSFAFLCMCMYACVQAFFVRMNSFEGVWTTSHGFLMKLKYKSNRSGFGDIWTLSDVFLKIFEYESSKSGVPASGRKVFAFYSNLTTKQATLGSETSALG